MTPSSELLGVMLRQMYSDVNGWTSIKTTTHNQRLRVIINKHIDELPRVVDMSGDGCCFAVGTESSEPVYFSILRDCKDRDSENCLRSEHTYSVWNFRHFWIWKVTCEYGESYNESSFYRQEKTHDDVVEKVCLGSLWKRGSLSRMYDVNAYGCLQRDVNFVGSMRQTSIVLHISTETVGLKFVEDSKNDRVQERTTPRAVNICYTGRLFGTIREEALQKMVRTDVGSRRGPCGSELHIDTAMGVVQIFGNNNSYRQITCKAFVSKQQADSVIEYICNMVRAPATKQMLFVVLALELLVLKRARCVCRWGWSAGLLW